MPRAWENDDRLTSTEKAFYEYFSCIFEAWDGPWQLLLLQTATL
ncbi:MAG: hypothetical protein Q9M89_07575 [Persephonella sp.]|nr:hypothetical protein [Persephonella sp.]